MIVDMISTRTLVFASVVAAAMIFGGVLGATAMARNTLTPASAAANASFTAANTSFTAASPAPPAFHSNETATHEAGESAAQETAENNGTFHPAGIGGGTPGHSNETSAHEATETPAREAQEKAGAPAPPAAASTAPATTN
jgi:hypothetical protein